MVKYRKKPVVVDAEQYTEYGKLVRGMCNSLSCYGKGNTQPHVHTIHDGQIVLLEVGDYVIPEPDGKHFYPIKPDIFVANYEPADMPAHTEAEIERLRQQLAKIEAGAAVMREALTLWRQAANMDYEEGQNWRTDRAWRDAYVALDKALSSNAGAEILERLRKLEAVAEAAKSIVLPECERCSSFGECTKDEEDCGIYKLKCALEALRGDQAND